MKMSIELSLFYARSRRIKRGANPKDIISCNKSLNHSIPTGRRVISSAVSQRVLQRDGVHRRNGSHRQRRAQPTTLLITTGRRPSLIQSLLDLEKVRPTLWFSECLSNLVIQECSEVGSRMLLLVKVA